MTTSPQASAWSAERNIDLSKSARRREALIYILGRVGKEPLPPEAWAFLSMNLFSENVAPALA